MYTSGPINYLSLGVQLDLKHRLRPVFVVPNNWKSEMPSRQDGERVAPRPPESRHQKRQRRVQVLKTTE